MKCAWMKNAAVGPEFQPESRYRDRCLGPEDRCLVRPLPCPDIHPFPMPASIAASILSLPLIKSGYIGDAIHQGRALVGCVRLHAQGAQEESPLPAIGAFEQSCSNSRKTTANAAGAAREHNDIIETFPADRANQALRIAVLPGRTW